MTSSSVPTGWRRERLGESAEILDNLRVPLSVSQRLGRTGPFPYCGANGVLDYIDDYMIDDDVVLLAEDGGNFDQFGSRPIAYRMKGKIWVNNHAHVLKAAQGGDTGYLFYALVHRDIRPYISSSTRSKLTRGELVRIEIPLPSDIAEQRRIVEVLTDADGLISALGRLIAKKEAIKQGMMQQLLTGEARLPGFTGKWSEVRLGDIASVKTGSRNNQDKQIAGRYPFYVRSATVEQINTYSYDCEAVLVPGEGGIGSIFHYVDGKFEVHQRVYTISQFDVDTAGKFVYYYMKQFFGRHAMENSVKATVDSLRLPTFVGFAMRMPEDVNEQRAIAAVLDDSEADIGRLRTHLTKTKGVQRGMMQELLTGRTRLPVMEAAA
jgi:type I restriction enzyme, S subunit